MFKNFSFVRNADVAELLEIVLVSAVSTVLFIRFYLSLTGFPKIGGGDLHIAHMLWGGLLLLTALILAVSFVGNSIQNFAALLGGIGFGTFIDELGSSLPMTMTIFSNLQ